MKKRNNFTRVLRTLGALAALLTLVAFGPHFRMQRFATVLSAYAAPFQIPVQIPPKKPEEQREIPQVGGTTKVNVNLVRLYVTVRDKHGAIVTNLQKDDFKVYEDGTEQKIAFFSKDMTDPITLAMMIDTSGSEEYMLNAEKATASRFLRDILKKDDLATVISFDSNVNMLADFSDDQQVLQSAIEKAEINVPVAMGPTSLNLPGTVLYDAIDQVCAGQLPSEAGRKALIITTDAEDEGSTQTLRSAIEAAQQANAVIHVLLIADRGGFFARGALYSGSSVAHEMADQTGGRVISVRNNDDLDKAFDQISEELRSQYIVAYYPANAAANGAYRKIKVTTTQGLKVLTREGYYAPTHASE
ncbi:MAG: VWA domain-containing protein [Candidatus Acidiferrales bacterium]